MANGHGRGGGEDDAGLDPSGGGDAITTPALDGRDGAVDAADSEEEAVSEASTDSTDEHEEDHPDLEEPAAPEGFAVVALNVLWEVPAAPLGCQDLSRFGPNGPPMNILGFCPEAERIFVVNQTRLYGFSIPRLRVLAGCVEATDETWDSSTPLLGKEVNRLRCGRLQGRPVVTTVDGHGTVAVVPSDEERLRVALELKNLDPGSGVNVSTWGIALPSHEDGDGTIGELIVSGNDHIVKGWTVVPAKQGQWTVSGPSGSQAALIYAHTGNLPCIDMHRGRLLSMSLSGHAAVHSLGSEPLFRAVEKEDAPVRTVEVHRPSVLPALTRDGAESQDAARSAVDDSEEAQNEPAVPNSAHRSSMRSIERYLGEALWGACWVPLQHVGCGEEEPSTPAPAPGRMDWACRGVVLPGEIVTSSVFPFIACGELLRFVQALNASYGWFARSEVRGAHRQEQLILCFSSDSAWLLDGSLSVRCRAARLPFNAAFAHVVLSSGSATAVVAAKLDPYEQLWAITVQRRPHALRFRLCVHLLQGVRRGDMILGLALGSGGRVFTLTAGRRLTCYHFGPQTTNQVRLQAGTNMPLGAIVGASSGSDGVAED